MKITIALSDIKSQGGAKLFFDNLIKHIPEHIFTFTQDNITPDTDVVIYGNRHDFYKKAKKSNVFKIIQRTQGQRALSLQQPDDLHAVVCSSQKSYQHSNHPNKIFICNGIDHQLADSLSPIPSDILVSESRICKGQRVEKAIKWAIKNNRKITILGSGQNSAETTYKDLKRKYPQCNWVGLVSYTQSLQYIKGCNSLIMASSAHGLSNSVIAASYFQRPIINLGGVETIDKVPDIRDTAEQYRRLIEG